MLIGFYIFAFSCRSTTHHDIKKYPDGTIWEEKKYQNNGDTLNYDIMEYYNNGIVYKEAMVRSGKYVEKKISYYPNGKIKQIDSLLAPCNLGVKMCDEVLIHYYLNGRMADRRFIQNGKFNGLAQVYDSSTGYLIKQYEVVDDSLKTGFYKEYQENGVIGYIAFYKNDTLVQNEYFFDEKGDTLKYFYHTNGIIDLPYKKWLSNGRVLMGNYSKDKKKAIWVWYDSKGKELKRLIDNLKGKSMIVPE